ncbi:MAG: hypothetical protein SVZ03_17495 [Spirochaetota bacterium]|nr:hypothetical protein [Spirochaetota bacterium]
MESVLCLTLFYLLLFTPELKGALPFLETINTIPEGEIELAFREEIYRIEEDFRIETFYLGLGIISSLSIWYSIQYLHRGIYESSRNELGDSFFKLWVYLGDYYDDLLHLGCLCSFRLPTGKNAYSNEEWRNLSLGNHEIKIGPVIQLDVKKNIYLHLNIFYVFRQAYDEDFYSGIYLNPFEKKTYTKLFGLNYQSDKTFFEANRLKNDFTVFSLAINSDIVYPIIPYMGCYYSRKIYKNKNMIGADIPIEGCSIDPILFFFGCRYFLIESSFLGCYYVLNPVREKKYIKDIFGFDFSLQF